MGRNGRSHHRGMVGSNGWLVLQQWGFVVAWDGATAHIAAQTFQPLLRPFEARLMIWSATACHAAAADPAPLHRCHSGEWNDRMLVEMLLSMLIMVSYVKKVMPRGWAYFQARVAFTLAALNRLAQCHGRPADKDGFASLSMAEFSW